MNSVCPYCQHLEFKRSSIVRFSETLGTLTSEDKGSIKWEECIMNYFTEGTLVTIEGQLYEPGPGEFSLPSDVNEDDL